MNTKVSPSDSVIGSLCRELEKIKTRSESINYSINHCQSKSLILRLKNELIELRKRRSYIRTISKNIAISDDIDRLSVELLNELIGRSLVFL
tara:strand:- start:4239 stop:4514 length:276 start_codon:yes stop_codon:yes gene_type:complete